MIISCQLLCVFILYALSCSHNPCLSYFHHLQKCSRDVDGGEDGTIDADILEDDYQNEGANDAKDDDTTDVEMSYTKYEENSSKAVNFSLSQAPLD